MATNRTEREILKSAAAILGRRGGQSRSEAKVAAVRENGKLGGRPRKKQTRKAR